MLRDAIAAEDWPRALALGLEAWRASRSPALADLIDALSARVPPRAKGPRLDLQQHWMTAALAYEPAAVGPLLAIVQDRLLKADASTAQVIARLGDSDPVLVRLLRSGALPKHQRNRLARLCAIARWPDDPRAATVLAHWFARDGFAWDPPYDVAAYLEILAELLVRIGDARVVPQIADCIAHPRARTEEVRARQQVLARRIIDAIVPGEDDPEVVAWRDALAPARIGGGDAALWDAVAQEPEAIAPRMVLADHLLAHGDPRGELIALQCADEPRAEARIAQLVAKHWDAWLGDLALVVSRPQSELARGMLETVALGNAGTPAWAYTATALHRELACVRRWRTTRHANLDACARMLALRPRLDTLELRARDLSTFGAARDVWDVRHLVLAFWTGMDEAPAPAADVLVQVMRMFPRLLELQIGPPYPPGLAAAIPLLARAPVLARIVLEVYPWLEQAERDALRALPARFPIVEVHPA